MNQYHRMLELIEQLNIASKAYYHEDKETISNLEFDKLYDELVAIEKALDITLASSPTVKVGYEVLGELPKEAHQSPMLSLDKTKEISQLLEFVKNEFVLLSWKLDGLTVVLTYENGVLSKAVTRGNGEIGEVITNNAKTFVNLPLNIPYKGKLVVRGEAVISYEDFEIINNSIGNEDEKYKNPRNLCSGSVRQLNNEITASRRVKFLAFSLVEAMGIDFQNRTKNQLLWLKEQGIDIVEHEIVDKETVKSVVERFAKEIENNPYPSDGLVLTYDNISYGESLGRTAKFPKNSYAFKWEDELKETRLLAIEWSPSRTGLINPVAIFEPVELEGTTVSRASVHNISILKELELGIGDTISVYKANMIIPQVEENLTRSNNLVIPTECPGCGSATKIKKDASTEVLICENVNCSAKLIKSLSLFVSRNAMNIEGLSQASLEKFIQNGFVTSYLDIYEIEKFRDRILEMEGFGEKSYTKLLESIEKSKQTNLPKVLFALGIENVGLTNAKMICKALAYNPEKIASASIEELSSIDGVGPIIAESFYGYFQNTNNLRNFKILLNYLELENIETNQEQKLEGKLFVITGSVEHYKNRNEMKEVIERLGGKVTASVSIKTNYLINNDLNSTSSKNKKARELGVPILSELDLLELIQ